MLPPTIPTSFVPHSSPTASRRSSAIFTDVFSVLSYVVLFIVFALALGVFIYGRILSTSQSAKDAALTQAEAGIDQKTVESFVQLRDRLVAGKTLLANHVAFSGFFTALGAIVPTTARFVSLHLSLDDTGVAKIDGAGVAKNFNALAATSAAFAQDSRIKNAIFSDIVFNSKDNSVSFKFIATFDSKLVTFSP